MNYDDESLKESTYFVLNNGIFLVGEIKNKVVGFISGTVEVSIMDRKQILGAERLWCVRKEFRKSRLGLALLKKFEKMCKFKGATHLMISHLVMINSQSMQKLYKRMGFTHIEEHYAKRIS